MPTPADVQPEQSKRATGVVDEPRPPVTNPSSPTARWSSRPAASPSATVTRASRITRTQQGKPGLQTPLDHRCVRHSVTTGFRLAGSVNGKTGAHARILEADLALPAYPIAAARRRPARPGRTRQRRARPRVGRRARTRTSGSARASTSSDSPGSSSRATGSCTARAHEDRIPSCSVGTDASQGWRCHAGGCGARGAIYDLASVLLGGPWGPQLRGEAFKRARAYVIDVFGEPIGDHDGTASGRPGERSTR